jgi:hypothetical protein
MKTFKSTDALKQAALSKGASASVGGVKFNSTADKIAAVPTPKPEPVKPPEPAPALSAALPTPDLAPIVQSAVDAMAASVNIVTMDNAKVMAEVAKVMEKIAMQTTAPSAAPQADPAKAWKLKVNRDTRGFMDTVDITRVG